MWRIFKDHSISFNTKKLEIVSCFEILLTLLAVLDAITTKQRRTKRPMYTRIALRSTRTALNLRTMATTRQIVHTDSAPAAIGPYSQAIAVGNLLYTSGQIPLDPKTMQIVEGGVDAQTRQVLDNLKAVLEAGGSSLENVVKTTVFLKVT